MTKKNWKKKIQYEIIDIKNYTKYIIASFVKNVFFSRVPNILMMILNSWYFDTSGSLSKAFFMLRPFDIIHYTIFFACFYVYYSLVW